MTTLTHIVQEAVHILGRKSYYSITATDGSETTITDTSLSDRYDDDALTNGTVVITNTSDGGAPQGEFAEIEAYSESTNTVSIRAPDLLSSDGTFSSSSGWAVGTGWGISSGSASHTAGNTEALSGTSHARRLLPYLVTLTLATTTAGDGLTVSLGGTSYPASLSASGTHKIYITPENTSGTLSLTPAGGGGWEGTVDDVTIKRAFTAAVEPEDEAMLILPRYPLKEIRRAVNYALASYGDIPLYYEFDTTDNKKYLVPVDLKRNRIIKVQIRGTNDDGWTDISELYYYMEIAAPGVQANLIFTGSIPVNRKVRVWYWGPHPHVREWNDPIAEIFPSTLIALKTASYLIRWRGVSENTLQSANRIQTDLQNAESEFHIYYPEFNPPTVID